MKKPLNGVVIIKVKQRMNNRTESGLYKDTLYDVHGKMTICAEVVHVSEKGSNEVMLEVENGMPRTKEVEPVYIRNKDIKHNIGVGDRVYFHYLTLEDPHNLIKYEGGYWYYKVSVEDIFLSMRPDPNGKYAHDGRLMSPELHNQYVLGESYWGEGWEEVEVDGVKIGGKVSASGLVTETRDKYIENHAIITDIGTGIYPYSRQGEVKTGDVVLINKHCEFINEIENQERWIFTHQDILGILNNDKSITPVCDGVLIKLKERTYEGNLVVDVTKLPLINEGEIVAIGKKVDDTLFDIGDIVKFHPKRTRVIDETYAIVPEGNIYGILSYSL